MKTYTCDICGEEIKQNDMAAARSDRENLRPGAFGTMIEGCDICGECLEVGSDMDPKELFFRAWRERVKMQRA